MLHVTILSSRGDKNLGIVSRYVGHNQGELGTHQSTYVAVQKVVFAMRRRTKPRSEVKAVHLQAFQMSPKSESLTNTCPGTSPICRHYPVHQSHQAVPRWRRQRVRWHNFSCFASIPSLLSFSSPLWGAVVSRRTLFELKFRAGIATGSLRPT